MRRSFIITSVDQLDQFKLKLINSLYICKDIFESNKLLFRLINTKIRVIYPFFKRNYSCHINPSEVKLGKPRNFEEHFKLAVFTSFGSVKRG